MQKKIPVPSTNNVLQSINFQFADIITEMRLKNVHNNEYNGEFVTSQHCLASFCRQTQKSHENQGYY